MCRFEMDRARAAENQPRCRTRIGSVRRTTRWIPIETASSAVTAGSDAGDLRKPVAASASPRSQATDSASGLEDGQPLQLRWRAKVMTRKAESFADAAPADGKPAEAAKPGDAAKPRGSSQPGDALPAEAAKPAAPAKPAGSRKASRAAKATDFHQCPPVPLKPTPPPAPPAVPAALRKKSRRAESDLRPPLMPPCWRAAEKKETLSPQEAKSGSDEQQ